jgi:diguanylate cyclase (GGDEF)-like protein/PAS domain S-box-containing protein
MRREPLSAPHWRGCWLGCDEKGGAAASALSRSIKKTMKTCWSVLALLYLLAASGQASSAGELERVTLQLKWSHQFQFAGCYAAIEKGFFAEQGLSVELRERDPEHNPVDDVLAGRAQYGITDASLVLAALQGAPVVLVSQLFQHSPLVLFTRGGSQLRTAYDLVGKRVTADGSGITDSSVMTMLDKTLGDRNKAQLIPYGFRYRDLIEGKTDALAGHLTDQAFWFKQRGFAVHVIDPRDHGIDFYGDNLFTSREELKAHPQRVERMRRATLKGWRYAIDHPQEIAALILEKYNDQGLSREHLEYQARTTRKFVAPAGIEIGSYEPSRWQEIAETYVGLGLANSARIPREFFYARARSRLTVEERAYLDSLAVLRVPLMQGQPPLSFIESEQPAGYLNELFTEIAGSLGMRFEWMRGMSYADSLVALQRGAVDIIINDYSPSDDARAFSLESKSLLTVPFVAVGRSTAAPVRQVADLVGKPVAVVNGYRQTRVLQQRYPALTLIPVEAIDEGYRALRSGDADYYIDNASHAGFKLREQMISDLKIAGELPAAEVGFLELRFAVARDKPLLHSALVKALNAYGSDGLSSLRAKWLDGSAQVSKSSPSRLDLTIREREWLARHPRIEIGVIDAWPPFGFVDGDNGLVGFSVDLIEALNQRLDGVLVPVGGAWQAIYNAVAERRLPAVLDITAKPSRESLFNFTRPYLEIPHIIVARKDGPFLASEGDLIGKTLALEQGFGNIEYFRTRYPGVQRQLYPNTALALDAVVRGRADAYVGNRTVASYLLKEELMLDLEIQGRLRKQGSVLSIGTRKDWPILRDILDKALDHISAGERQRLLAKWVDLPVPSSASELRLSSKETAWLAQHPVLRIAPDPNFPPLEFFDNDGRYQGLVADYMRLIAERLGVELEVVRRETWSDAIDALRTGEADLIGANVPTDAFRKEFLFTESYLGFYDVIVTHQGIAGSVRLDDLAGNKVLVVKDWPEAEILAQHYPEIQAVEVVSTLDGLTKVACGEHDYLFTYLPIAEYLIQEQGLKDLRIAGFGPEPILDAVMVRKDATILRSILDKTLATLTPEEKWTIESRWIESTRDIGTLSGLGLTIAEQRWLREHPTIDLHTTDQSAPYQFKTEAGQASGIVPEIMAIVARRLGIRIRVIANGRAEAISGLQSGRFQLFGAMTANTLDPDMPYLQTRGFLQGHLVLFGRSSKPAIAAITEVRDSTIVVPKGLDGGLLTDLSEGNRIIRVDSLDEAIEILIAGGADYLVGISEIVHRLLHQRQYRGIRELYTHPKPVHGVMLVHNDQPLLRSILDKALKSLETRELPRILRKWYDNYPVALVLTEEETAWLSAHPVVRVALHPQWAPIEYRDETGRYTGISLDYLERLEAMLDIELEVVPDLSWKQALTAVQSRTADMFASVARTPERDAYALFTQPYIDLPIRIFAREDSGYFGDLGNLSGQRVAVAAGYAIEDWLAADHPDLTLVPVESIAEGLRRLSDGQVDAVVGNLLAVNYYRKKLDLQNVQEAGETPYRNNQSMAVRSDWPLFAGILQKALDTLSEQEHQSIYNRWMGIEFERSVDYQLLWQVVSAALLVLALVMIWNRRLAHEQQTLERRVAERTAELAASEQRYRGIVEDTPSMICRFRADGTIDYVNRAYCDYFRVARENLVGRNFLGLLPKSERRQVMANIRTLSVEQPMQTHEHQVAMPDKGVGWHRWTNRGIFDTSGGLIAYQAIGEDITERRKAEDKLRQSAAVFSSTAEGVLITDLDGTVIDINKAFSNITGYAPDEIIGENPRKLKSGQHDLSFYQAMWQSLIETGNWSGEIWNRRKDGSVYPGLFNISTVRDPNGQAEGYVGVFADITALKQTEQRLERLAHYDPLTDLPNRLLLTARLERAIKHAARQAGKIAVVFVDLDRFKTINDSLGHPAGDRLLAELAQRLAAVVRSDDTVARLGGDEFIVLLEDIDGTADHVRVVEKLMGVFKDPFDLDGNEVHVTASLGLSLYPQDGTETATLLRNADSAMYRAKEDGRNTYKFYTEELTNAAFQHMFIENALRGALQNEEFRLVFQPQVDLATGHLTGIETLLRWQHPMQGDIPPGLFIPIAEHSGLIQEIGDWVLVAACRQGREWLDRGLHIGRIAVNVAGPQIQQTDFVMRVISTIKEIGFPPEYLELEVTESFVMRRREDSVGQLQAIRDLGIAIAIDDFGTGYSSLSYLKQLPIDKLKIDQSFVRDIPADANDQAIAEAVIALGKALDKEVIAEGVETAEQAEFLKSKGCAQAQGYFFGRPVPAEDMESMLRAYAGH